MSEIRRLAPPKTFSRPLQLTVIFTAATLVAVYIIVRYSGAWVDTDTVAFAEIIKGMLADPVLVPATAVYSHGYGYQTLAISMIQISNIALPAFQLLGGLLLMLWLILPAWLMNREFTGSSAGATLATVILLIQPEFLFTLLRGSHEKFSRGLMFLALFVLLYTLHLRPRPKNFASFVFVFYLLAYALIAINSLIAFSFIFSVGVALTLLYFASRLTAHPIHNQRQTAQRFLFVMLAMLLISFIFIFYLYKPVQSDLRLLNSTWDRAATLILEVETQASNPYGVIISGWVHPAVYAVMSAANWLILLGSASIWFWQSYIWFWPRKKTKAVPSNRQLILWVFYGSFALLGLVSILVDLSGAIAGNLQHRVFPSFVMVAAPLFAAWLIAQPVSSKIVRRMISLTTIMFVCLLAILAVLKASNEPLVSNKWLLFLPAESEALDWSDEYLAGRTLWAEFDGRLRRSWKLRNPTASTNILIASGTLNANSPNYMVSDLTRLRANRLSLTLPISIDNMITYDNGQTQVFHERPRTPFQR